MSLLPTNKSLQQITNLSGTTSGSSIRTKGKIIDVQYEVFKVDDFTVGTDPGSAKEGIDGLATYPAYSKSQWLNCQ
jgi:hypothetical protein